MNPLPPGPAYRLLSTLLLPFWWLHALRHGRKYGLGEYARMRWLGGVASGADAQVWVHAASVGEVRAAAPLIERLLERGENLLVTSFTASGYQAIGQLFAERVNRAVAPVDFALTCRRFFRRHPVKCGLIVETELWPELVYQAHRQAIPLFLVNARLSQRSMDANPFVRRLLGRVLQNFTGVLARGPRDREQLIRLGAPVEIVEVVGNLKTARQAPPPVQRLVERDYLLLASSHAGEEREFLRRRDGRLEDMLLVIAPRHPQRGDDIQRELESLGVSVARRSLGQTVDDSTQVYLADTLGEMASLMAFARIVVMGGSFDQTGGHNLIEPANLDCAIITGPSDANIREDIKLLGDGIVQVGDMTQCWKTMAQLCADPERVRELGRQARQRLDALPDVVGHYLQRIESRL